MAVKIWLWEETECADGAATGGTADAVILVICVDFVHLALPADFIRCHHLSCCRATNMTLQTDCWWALKVSTKLRSSKLSTLQLFLGLISGVYGGRLKLKGLLTFFPHKWSWIDRFSWILFGSWVFKYIGYIADLFKFLMNVNDWQVSSWSVQSTSVLICFLCDMCLLQYVKIQTWQCHIFALPTGTGKPAS